MHQLCSSSVSTVTHPVRWLEGRGLEIVGTPDTDPELDPYNRLTENLGNNPEVFRSLIRAAKHWYKGKSLPVCLDLIGQNPADVERIVRFGREAHRSGLFTFFRHDRHCGRVQFQLQNDHRVINFFTGVWFEKFVLETVVCGLSDLGAGDESLALTRTVVRVPDGQMFELDILIGTHDRILFFECKSGRNIAMDLLRHRAFVRTHLRLTAKRAAFVALEQPDRRPKKQPRVPFRNVGR